MDWALAFVLAVLGFPFAVAGAVALFLLFLYALYVMGVIS
jgi:hypothetical protein